MGIQQPLDSAAIQPRRRLLLALLTAGCLVIGAVQATAANAAAGQVNVIRDATSSFDSYTSGATLAQQQWMRDHYYRMRGYAPYFDQALGWAPPTNFYRDLYAIYSDSTTLISQHPDWVLKDSSGRKLYIPWACNGTSCTQYAADVGNSSFRRYWIERAKNDMAKGYHGIFIDDVNLEMKVGDASGDFVRPIDPRTGQEMTNEAWRRYMAEFTEDIRDEIPSAYIVHNTAWWMEHSDTYVQREIDAADAIELERGFSDTGLTGGTGKYGYLTLLSHIDWLHSRGKSVVLEPYLSTSTQRMFELASYFLISTGSDAICTSFQTDPESFWGGWETDLGAKRGDRYEWNDLLRRDFEGGFVLVNPPGATRQTVSLGGSYAVPGGGTITSVTLGAREGAVLIGQTPTKEPTEPEPAEEPSDTEAQDQPAIESESQQPAQPVSEAEPEEPRRSKPRKKRSVSISGKVRTRRKATRLMLVVKRRTRRHFAVARRVRVLTRRNGRFKAHLRRLPVGRYRIVAHTAASHTGRVVLHRRVVLIR